MADEKPVLINGFSPEAYAAQWGGDPVYDTPPGKPGDGYMFYNFGSPKHERTPRYLVKFMAAIERMQDRVRTHELTNWEKDLAGLSNLWVYVRSLIPAIPLAACEDRRLYRISSRNFVYGVFSAETRGFVGIREKFGSEYLFTEYHFDTGAPFGTVIPQYATAFVVPPELSVKEYLGTECSECGGELVHDPDKPATLPAMIKGGWRHTSPGCDKPRARSVSNRALFGWIQTKAKEDSDG
jgi:hypothetical protein